MSRVRMEIYQLKTAPGTSFRKSQSLKGLKTHGMKLEAGLYELVYASDLTRQGNRLDGMVNYHGEYLEEDAAVVRDYIDLLAKFGFTFSEKEYYDILNGKSELYTKEKAEAET